MMFDNWWNLYAQIKICNFVSYTVGIKCVCFLLHTNQTPDNVKQYSTKLHFSNMMKILTLKNPQLKTKDLSKNVSKVKLHESFAK